MLSFVLAAGESVRFQASYPKQHIEINGETLLSRILRSFPEPTLVTHLPHIGPTFSRRFIPQSHRYTSETILSTRHLWSDEATILYSDVYYSDAAIQTINSCTAPLTFFTDGQDIFAIKVRRTHYGLFTPSLETAVSRGHLPEGNKGRVWEAYRHLNKSLPWPVKPTDGLPYLTFLSDETQDFDTTEDLGAFHAGNSKNILCK
jgi:hypothetical protein